jgi:hypothetical protein
MLEFYFNFYKFACIINFDKINFKTSKVQALKSTLIYSLILLTTFISFPIDEEEDLEKKTEKKLEQSKVLSNFSTQYFSVTKHYHSFALFLVIIFIIVSQNDIKIMFKCFVQMKKLCEEGGFSYSLKELKDKMLKYFFLMQFYYLYILLMQSMMTFKKFNFNELIFIISTSLMHYFDFAMVSFITLMCLIINFIMENFNEALDNELQKFIHNHEKINQIIASYDFFDTIFATFNRSIAKILSVQVFSVILTLMNSVFACLLYMSHIKGDLILIRMYLIVAPLSLIQIYRFTATPCENIYNQVKLKF